MVGELIPRAGAVRLGRWVIDREAVIAVGAGECVDEGRKLGEMTGIGLVRAVERPVGWQVTSLGTAHRQRRWAEGAGHVCG